VCNQHLVRNSNEKSRINHARQLPNTLIEQRWPLNHAKVEIKNSEVVIGDKGCSIRGCPPRHRHLKTLM
jgi:hypothetical protein